MAIKFAGKEENVAFSPERKLGIINHIIQYCDESNKKRGGEKHFIDAFMKTHLIDVWLEYEWGKDGNS